MILDFGCGDCRRWDHWLKRHGGKTVIGIDIDLNSIRRAKQRIQNGTEFLVCDGRNLPFKDGCFHRIHIDGVLHHLSDTLKGLGEISRTLDGALQVEESVDDYFVFRIARRVLKQWGGTKIRSFFYSYQLEEELKKYFRIKEIKYRYSSLLGNILSYLGISNNYCYYHYFPIFDRLDFACSSLLNRLGLLKYFCTHVQILASS